VTFRSEKLLSYAKGMSCIRCGREDGTVVCAHYTGARRSAYGGGLGIKVHDFICAHLCSHCHREMDILCRDKEGKWLHSEEFQHVILLTLIRLFNDDKLSVR
jgi:hypothetical protein